MSRPEAERARALLQRADADLAAVHAIEPRDEVPLHGVVELYPFGVQLRYQARSTRSRSTARRCEELLECLRGWAAAQFCNTSRRAGATHLGVRKVRQNRAMLAAPRNLDSLPWITNDGYLDMLKVPLESVYGRVCEDDPQAVRSALGVLAAAAGHGRNEAAVFLLGFFVALPPEDWTLRAEAVEALRHVRTPACASLFLAELDRVKSSNSTRRYLDRILDVLAFFPADLVSDKLDALARDRRFSSRMRAKLRACGLEADRHSGRRAGMPPAA